MSWTAALPNVAAFVTRHPRLARLINGVLEGPGATDPALRQAAALSGAVPPAWTRYLEKLAKHAYRITDEEMVALKQAGTSEDAILDVSVAGALGAAMTRLERGLAASAALDADAKKGGEDAA